MTDSNDRRLAVGAEPAKGGGFHFRVWAPDAAQVEVVFDDGQTALLAPESAGYFSAHVPGASTGARYRYRLDRNKAYPDPASRSQPDGPHGPSQLVDPHAFRWSDTGWAGAALPGQVVYELHLGTFTRGGTWSAAERELPELADLGVTVIEVMPVAEFAGRWGWGYDGVNLFAPSHLYGSPDDMRRFVDRAHRLGIAIILDVVYNHLGPDGNYLGSFSKSYFTDRYSTDWGAAINFDGPDSGPVREYYVANAGYWIDEFHLDGLRLDATQNIYDKSPEHVLAAIGRKVRQSARGRQTILVAENEPQQVKVVRPVEQGGYGLDALWNDDFHHTARVALTGSTEAYYADYGGKPQEFVSSAKYGYLYQGQRYAWQGKRRGTPSFGVSPAAFVTFIQNHDQIANSGDGRRIHELTSPGRLRALTALMLLAPGTPMLFQGQEFAADSPFLYFADHNPELAPLVRRGRAEFLSQFPSLAPPEVNSALPDPASPETFERCKLDFADRQRHSRIYAFHRDLLRLRREHSAIRAQRAGSVDGAVLWDSAFALRYLAGDDKDLLLLVNLGRQLCLPVVPEPLLGPPEGRVWRLLWSSESPAYTGTATPAVERDDGWHLPPESAVLLAAEAVRDSAGS